MILTITTREFDNLADALAKALRERLEQEQASADQSKDKPSLESDIWSTLPKIDSKIAYKATAALEDVLKENALDIKIPASVIKNGGYSSNDEAVTDIMGKLRSACSDAQANAS